jgi:serine/threonine-protein kinase
VPRETITGTTLAGYSIEGLVGEGGTATVYRASHPTHGTVAFKVLKEKLRQDRTALARFQREARFGTQVVHPNVVKTIELGETDATLPYLVIEWAPGELLEKYAKRNAPLPPDEVATIVSQTADAVFATHAAGIVHRDLKPENLMYDPEHRVVKLLDFGIATHADASADERLTRAGFFVGTLMYVAPEALSGELVQPAADQYSLATIAYFLLTGTLPYVAKTPREMFTMLLSQPPVPLSRAKPGLTFAPEVEAVVMQGLAKAPGERYPDVKSFADALARALAKGPPSPGAAAPGAGLLGKLGGLFRGK